MSLTALIDADTIVYRCAAASENEPEDIAILRTDQMMMDVLGEADNYVAFLTGKNNFRYTIYPEYKANRKDKPKPQWLGACRDYLMREYGATVTDGYEADDALGMAQNGNTVIYSVDKDLMMIPGCHYNFIKKIYQEISEIDGLRVFYKQMLIGDRADNIKGIDGIGPVKAGKLIDHLDNEEEMRAVVEQLYGDNFFHWEPIFNMNADCLWIWRELNGTYTKRMERGPSQGVHNVSAEGGVSTMASEI